MLPLFTQPTNLGVWCLPFPKFSHEDMLLQKDSEIRLFSLQMFNVGFLRYASHLSWPQLLFAIQALLLVFPHSFLIPHPFCKTKLGW